jgi:hypothetical protein
MAETLLDSPLLDFDSEDDVTEGEEALRPARERLLVSNVVLVAVSEGSELRLFNIAASSKATIAKAVANRRGRTEPWFTCAEAGCYWGLET